MNNKLLVGVIVLAFVLIGGYLLYTSGPVVSAQGSAELNVQPDKVSVFITVETRGQTAGEAQEQNKKISETLIVDLVIAGFERKELQFVNYNVYPEYDWNSGSQKLKGYVVSQQLVVATEDVTKVPTIVDVALTAGALVSFINFDLSDAQQKYYKNQALTEASKDARDKASAIAEGQGKNLGRLVSLQNQEFHYPGPIVYYDKAMVAEGMSAEASVRRVATTITPQGLTVTASVGASYKLSIW